MYRSYWRVCVAKVGAALRDIEIDQEAHEALHLDSKKLEWNIVEAPVVPGPRDDDDRPETDGLPCLEGHNTAAAAARQLIAEHPEYTDRIRIQLIDDSFDGPRVLESADSEHDFLDMNATL
jgi:hypothetical protein